MSARASRAWYRPGMLEWREEILGKGVRPFYSSLYSRPARPRQRWACGTLIEAGWSLDGLWLRAEASAKMARKHRWVRPNRLATPLQLCVAVWTTTGPTEAATGSVPVKKRSGAVPSSRRFCCGCNRMLELWQEAEENLGRVEAAGLRERRG